MLTDYHTDPSGALTPSYQRGADGLISQTGHSGQTPITAYSLYNPHGDTAALTDQTGNITNTYRYDAFGGAISGENPRNGYTGKWQRDSDNATGTIRMGVREYDPALGRFVSADPLKGEITDPQQRNRYTYTSNNPLVRYDLNGMWWGSDAWGWVEDRASDWWEGAEIGWSPPSEIPGAALAVFNPLPALEFLTGYDDFQQMTAFDSSWSERLEGGTYFALGFVPGGKGGKIGKMAAKCEGQAAKKFTKDQLKQFERQLAEHGSSSLLRSRATIEKRLDEHLGKLEEIKRAGGNTSSVEREIRNFRQQISAIDEVLRK